ncbi:DMT family transporter [Paraburkholderia sp. Ac-20340]|uniref:DMT family transporter n=1 Tax=Paraburkholderia sp. Ac-20340 TaxID=2703888 RepID=UPI001F11C834|nr:DMT family transporter [Paraburkholderia sp. Ac-20340]MBN3853438.1 DMT family transporter [Paraburkholderia sp. Ac-20340]
MLQEHSASRTWLGLILASTFLQGSSFVSTKIVLADVAPLWTAALRFLVASLSLLPFMYSSMRQQKLGLRDLPWAKLAIIGSLQTTGVMAFLNLGLESTTPSTAAILMASNPLLVVILARIWLREAISASALSGLIVAFIGVVICIGIAGNHHAAPGHGEWLVALASACWAGSTVLNKKFNLALSAWVLTFWQMLIGAILLALLAAGSGQPFSLPATAAHWGAFAWLCIPASTAAMGLWFAALRLGGSVQTSGFLFLCPLFAAIITFCLTGQLPHPHELVGGCLIGIGLYLLSKRRTAQTARALPAIRHN